MSTSQASTGEQKSHDASIVFDLELGNCVLALDRLYGTARAQKVAAHLKQKKVYPIISCAAIDIMNTKNNNKSVLLNALDLNNVVWCFQEQNVLHIHQFENCPIFDTSCSDCSRKITFVAGESYKSKYGRVDADWRIYSGNTVIYQCEIYILICPDCDAKLQIVTTS